MNSDIRDASGRLLGRIKFNGTVYEARDSSSRLKGTYNPKLDETKDATGRRVASGNMLSFLIGDPTR